MTIMNIGTTNGEPNLVKYNVKGGDKSWYVAGSTSPFGPNYSGSGGSEVDGYKVMKMTTQCLKLHNPISAAEIIPAISIY